MHAIADTQQLVTDGIISTCQASKIEARAREIMVALAINSLLCGGILASSGGLIFWLADALSVAILGSLALVAGLTILARKSALFGMFGNAASLIGAGMLVGGGCIELLQSHKGIAGPVMSLGGGAIAGAALFALMKNASLPRFVVGAIALMGGAAHLFGLYTLIGQSGVTGLPIVAAQLYCMAALVIGGWVTNLRLVTALAIVPFAQILDTGTFYRHAVYAFYSPESTLSILQMTALVTACLWIAANVSERTARHARLLAIMGFIVANLCALVGSLWGDVVGQSIWGPGSNSSASGMDYRSWKFLIDAYEREALVISKKIYSVLWAVALAAIVMWSAHKNNRGVFNAALTFGGIHAYTQLMANYGHEPLAFVIGGLAAIPIAWSMWQANHWLIARDKLAAM